MRIVVTGAGGFIGRAVVDRIVAGALGDGHTLVLNDLHATPRAGTLPVPGSFAERDVREALLDGRVDLLYHLASLPGGAAEADLAAGRSVNLDATLALVDAAAARSARPPVVVYASSIAALGFDGRAVIAPDTPLRPAGSYGTHKAMVELYLADLTRRGAIDSRGLRPAGIVARPVAAYAGFATAWMSELFRGLHVGRDVTLPWRSDALIWLQSVDAVAAALIHAAQLPVAALGPVRTWTLPATVASLDEVAGAIQRRTGTTSRIAFGNGAGQPRLDAADATALGFVGDGDVDALAMAVLAALEREALAPTPDIPYTGNMAV